MVTNYIFLIGCGRLQEPMIREIHQRGYQVMATDRDPNAYCRWLVDDLVTIDTYDVLGHLDYAESLADNPPQAVLTDAADVAVTASALAAYWGLPSIEHSTVVRLQDKTRLRLALDMPHPVYLLAHTNQRAGEVWFQWKNLCCKYNISHELVLKPADACASRGVHRIESYDDFERHYAATFGFNHHAKDIILEERLHGQEYATDWFVEEGRAIYVNGTKRIFGDFGLELGHINPAWEIVPEAVQQLAQRVVKATGIYHGPLKIDLLNDRRYGFCVLETAARWSGGYDHGFSAKVASGRNLEKPLLDFALGLPLDKIDFIPKKYSTCAVYAPQLQSQTHIDDAWITHVKQAAGVVDVIWTGRQPKGVWDNCADREVFVIAEGTSEMDAWRKAVNAVDSMNGGDQWL